jgi:hypothetical protein
MVISWSFDVQLTWDTALASRRERGYGAVGGTAVSASAWSSVSTSP